MRLPAWLTARRAVLAAGGVVAVLGGGLLLMRALPQAIPSLPSLPSLAIPKMPALPFRAALVEGEAEVLGGDMLKIGERSIRLAGIEAPDAAQRCQRSGRRTWRCGVSARRALDRLVRGGKVRCESGSRRADGTTEGRCHAGETDIAAALVRGGHVFAATGLLASYGREETEARAAGAGIWGGIEPERPAAWRERMWAEAKEKAPDGCPIKGEVTRNGRRYLLPWSERYPRARINTRRGERWFCSEEEAVAAGWRSAGSG